MCVCVVVCWSSAVNLCGGVGCFHCSCTDRTKETSQENPRLETVSHDIRSDRNRQDSEVAACNHKTKIKGRKGDQRGLGLPGTSLLADVVPSCALVRKMPTFTAEQNQAAALVLAPSHDGELGFSPSSPSSSLSTPPSLLLKRFFTSCREANLAAPRFHRKQTGAREGARCCFAILEMTPLPH